MNLVNYKRLNYKLCYLTLGKLAAETCQGLATLYPTSLSVLYSAQCVSIHECFLYKSASNPSYFILLANLYTP